jgi:hypothetical protein
MRRGCDLTPVLADFKGILLRSRNNRVRESEQSAATETIDAERGRSYYSLPASLGAGAVRRLTVSAPWAIIGLPRNGE